MYLKSYIISSKDKLLSKQIALSMCRDLSINTFDITYILKKEIAASIGIKDIKEMMQKIYLKPLKGKNKAIIIEDAELLTNEAQNSLLKVLEEPPNNTTIILLSTSKEVFLPTILSRCTQIDLKVDNPTKIDQASRDLFLSFTNLSTAKALELAETLSKNKENAPIELEKLIIAGRELILSEKFENNTKLLEVSSILKKMQNTHLVLVNTNTNTRLTLENLFLTFSLDE